MKHGNETWQWKIHYLVRWFSYWHPNFEWIYNCSVWLPEGIKIQKSIQRYDQNVAEVRSYQGVCMIFESPVVIQKDSLRVCLGQAMWSWNTSGYMDVSHGLSHKFWKIPFHSMVNQHVPSICSFLWVYPIFSMAISGSKLLEVPTILNIYVTVKFLLIYAKCLRFCMVQYFSMAISGT